MVIELAELRRASTRGIMSDSSDTCPRGPTPLPAVEHPDRLSAERRECWEAMMADAYAILDRAEAVIGQVRAMAGPVSRIA